MSASTTTSNGSCPPFPLLIFFVICFTFLFFFFLALRFRERFNYADARSPTNTYKITMSANASDVMSADDACERLQLASSSGSLSPSPSPSPSSSSPSSNSSLVVWWKWSQPWTNQQSPGYWLIGGNIFYNSDKSACGGQDSGCLCFCGTARTGTNSVRYKHGVDYGSAVDSTRTNVHLNAECNIADTACTSMSNLYHIYFIPSITILSLIDSLIILYAVRSGVY